MAWTAPRTWVTGEVVTAALLNTHIRDNQLELSTHVHNGVAGEGADDLTGLDTLTFDDQSANPASVGIMQRNGTDLVYYSDEVVVLSGQAAAGVPSLRQLGTGATDAAAGNHSHTLSVNAQVTEGFTQTSTGSTVTKALSSTSFASAADYDTCTITLSAACTVVVVGFVMTSLNTINSLKLVRDTTDLLTEAVGDGHIESGGTSNYTQMPKFEDTALAAGTYTYRIRNNGATVGILGAGIAAAAIGL